MRLSIFWQILAAIYIFAAAVAYFVQPASQTLSPYLVINSQQSKNVVVQSDGSFKVTFDSTALTGTPLAIMAPAHYGELSLRLNDAAVRQLPQRPHMQISRYHKLYEADVPAGIIKTRDNILEVQRTGSMRDVAIPDVYVGPKTQLRAFGDRQELLITWVDRVTLIIILMGLVVTAALLFFSRKIAHYAYFFLMFALLLLQEFRHHIYIFSQPLMSFMTYLGMAYLLLSALSFSHWTNGPPRERTFVLGLATLALGIVFLIELSWGLDNIATVPARTAVFCISGIAMLTWFTRRLSRRLGTMPPELIMIFGFASAFSLGYLIALITLFGDISAPLRLFLVCFTNIAETLAFSGLLATAAIHEIGAYRRELAKNERMASLVSGRVLYLDEEAQRLKSEITSSAVIEERQRFTRDIHDGIGGQLLSLLLKARSGTLTHDQAENEVSRSIADLRLITAALDASDDGFAFALRRFGDRARDQLDAADIALVWQMSDGFDLLRLDPRNVLEILRWLQEALTNAIAHSGANVVTIACSTSNTTPLHLKFEISDNGAGFRVPDPVVSMAGKAGRGLANMADRARRLGGIHQLDSSSTGTKLSLQIPLTGMMGVTV